MWLSLLPYLLSGQVVWVQDGPSAQDDVWFGQITVLLPTHIVLRTAAGCQDDPYLVVIPIERIYCVRERHGGGDKNRLEAIFRDSPDGPPPSEVAP